MQVNTDKYFIYCEINNNKNLIKILFPILTQIETI